jgi:Domain of unknown function (DUF4259)
VGAWGYGPMENDLAPGWLAEEVEEPLIAAITRALRAFLDSAAWDDVKAAEAEAAAALLVDLTGGHAALRYAPFGSGYLAYRAEELRLRSPGAEAVEKMLSEEAQAWLGGLSEPAAKRLVLGQLLADLQHGT